MISCSTSSIIPFPDGASSNLPSLESSDALSSSGLLDTEAAMSERSSTPDVSSVCSDVHENPEPHKPQHIVAADINQSSSSLALNSTTSGSSFPSNNSDENVVSSGGSTTSHSDDESQTRSEKMQKFLVNPLIQAPHIVPTHSTPAPLSDQGFQCLRSYLGLSTSSFEPIAGIHPLPRAQGVADVILASIDCEAFEDERRQVTEVGVSFLDVRNIEGVAPGPHGKQWFDKIEYRHYVVDEYKHLVNTKQLQGCPDKFSFGTTEVVKQEDVKDILKQLFTRVDGRAVAAANEDVESSAESDTAAQAPTPKHRSIVLVGHSLAEDLKYLKLLNFDVVSHLASLNVVENRSTITGAMPPRRYPIPMLDTHTLVQSLSILLSVGKLVYMLGVLPENLHNAGNDAAYTLQGLIMLAFRCGEALPVPYWPRELLTFRQRHKRDEQELAARAGLIRNAIAAVQMARFLGNPKKMLAILSKLVATIKGWRWRGSATSNTDVPATTTEGFSKTKPDGASFFQWVYAKSLQPITAAITSSPPKSEAGDEAPKKPKTEAQIARAKRARQNRKNNARKRKEEAESAEAAANSIAAAEISEVAVREGMDATTSVGDMAQRYLASRPTGKKM